MEQLLSTNFTTLDWLIVGVYLATSIVIGIWANRYVGNLTDYLVAGRTLRIRLALATMTGTELGLVTVMYSAELGFTQQYASLYLSVIEGASLLAVGLTGLIVYRLRCEEILTIPEFYERRYSRGVRVLGGTMLVLAGVLNMGLFLKAGSEFLTSISGLEDVIYLKWIMTSLLLLVLFYTVLGGMVSVVITDLIQFLVLGVGMVIVTGFVVAHVGTDGFQAVVDSWDGYFDPTSAENPSRLSQHADPEVAKLASPVGLLTITFQSVVIFTAIMLWPAGASRTFAVKTPEIAQRMYLFSVIPFLARRALPVLWGIGAYAFFFGLNDALGDTLVQAIQAGDVSTRSAMPLFLAKIIPTGILGLVTAGMVAAFMSTHDSYLLCWSGVITQDIVAPLFGPLSDRARILITRIAIVCIGAALLFWGLWYELKASLWDYMAITGTLYLAGVLPVVAGGLYWRRSSTVGAYGSLIGGSTAILGLGPVVERLRNLTGLVELQSAHMSLLAFAISGMAFVAGSILFPDSPQHESAV
ncbi:MAG: sodium:solute symporter family protein [Planctomycetota bacterium]|nr:sodium:solute symporter family protein [Planctomycetota bacterium]